MDGLLELLAAAVVGLEAQRRERTIESKQWMDSAASAFPSIWLIQHARDVGCLSVCLDQN